MQLIDITAI